MALSEWTGSIGAVSNTTVADDFSPGVNSKCRVPYHPLIGVLLFLLILSVFYFKQSLWRCGQLSPYVGMCSLGTPLHRDYNAMGNAAKISPRVPSTCAQNAILSLLITQIIPRRQINVAIDNPLLVSSVSCLNTSSYLWNDVCAADIVSHAANLQSNGCRCYSPLYKFRDGIQVTRIFMYYGGCQG